MKNGQSALKKHTQETASDYWAVIWAVFFQPSSLDWAIRLSCITLSSNSVHRLWVIWNSTVFVEPGCW